MSDLVSEHPVFEVLLWIAKDADTVLIAGMETQLKGDSGEQPLLAPSCQQPGGQQVSRHRPAQGRGRGRDLAAISLHLGTLAVLLPPVSALELVSAGRGTSVH